MALLSCCANWLPCPNSVVAAGIVVLLSISGIYAIPYTDVSADWIVHSKRIYYLIIMAVLALMALMNRFSPIDLRFDLSCGVLVLVYAGQAFVRQEMPGEYVYNLLSIAFIWLFVRYLAGASFPIDRFLENLRAGTIVINLLALFVLILCMAGDREIQQLVVSGFDGNRVNFSIWLWQVVFLNFFLAGQSRRGFFLALVGASILLTLQSFSGGRIGLLASMATAMYFTLRRTGETTVKVAVISFLIGLVLLSGYFSPISKAGEDISIFRFLSPPQLSQTASPSGGGWYFSDSSASYADSQDSLPIELQWVEETMNYADSVSGHRVRILVNAVKALDFRSIMLGKGIGHFDVAADTRIWMVHNVFLKTLGELGIAALLPFLVLMWLPFKRSYRGAGEILYFMLLVAIAVGMLQPRFLITGLSNCLVVWLCYALILRQARCPGCIDTPNSESGLFAATGYQKMMGQVRPQGGSIPTGTGQI